MSSLMSRYLVKTAATNVSKEKVHGYLAKNYPKDTLKWVKSAEWTEEEVPLSKIRMSRRPGGAREKDKVKGIAKAFDEGKPMEAVVLIKTAEGDYKVADGYHRTLGCKHSGKTKIKAWVGNVIQSDGPWDKEMHARKLNVGKVADEIIFEMEKQASIAKGIASLGTKMVKSTGNEVKNFGKGITGVGTKKARKNLDTVKSDGGSGRVDIKNAQKDVGKERRNQAKSWGIVGLGGASAGINEVAKRSENAPEIPQQDTFTGIR